MKFASIKTLPRGEKREWAIAELLWTLAKFVKSDNLTLDAPYQRGYVWTEAQKIAYVEHILREGIGGRDIYVNHPGWNSDWNGQMEVVDGKQRLTALTDFLTDKIPAHGYLYSQYQDKLTLTLCLTIHITKLKSQKEVVEYYLALNRGGSIHTEEDLKPAYDLLNSLE